jgi:hypothetical protein
MDKAGGVLALPAANKDTPCAKNFSLRLAKGKVLAYTAPSVTALFLRQPQGKRLHGKS